MSMTQDEVIIRFCKLQEEVSKAIADYSKANDCFCPEKTHPTMSFQSSGASLEYIEEAVRARLKLEAPLREKLAKENQKYNRLRDLLDGEEDR